MPLRRSDCGSAPRVVLLCGISGSGKTFYARGLEKEGYERISADEIAWRVHGAALPSLSAKEQRRAFSEAAEEIDRRLAQIIRDGGRAVVDSTLCRRARRDALRAICRAGGVEPQLVYMDTPLPLLVGRMRRREGHGPDDQRVPEERLKMFFNGFERPGADENPIVIKQ